jgi:predicted DNA-binding transcriptional regulator YafY
MGISTLNLHRAKADTAVLRQVLTKLLRSFTTIGSLFAVTHPLAFLDFAVAACDLPKGLGDLVKAIEARLPAMMVYAGGSRAESLRTVTPLAVVEYGQRQYLQAVCHLAQVPRTFRIDRIRTLRLTTQ